jgi:hypothetical protein
VRAISVLSSRFYDQRKFLSAAHCSLFSITRFMWLCYLSALGDAWQPDRGKWLIHLQQHCGRRPHLQFRLRRKPGLRHTVHAPVLATSLIHLLKRADERSSQHTSLRLVGRSMVSQIPSMPTRASRSSMITMRQCVMCFEPRGCVFATTTTLATTGVMTCW